MKNETKARLKSIPIIKHFYPLFSIIIGLINKNKAHRKFRWMQKQMMMVDPCSEKRQKYWKKCGAHIEGNINIGSYVYFDAGNASNITIEDGVWIASKCLFLCHRRIVDDYCVGDDYNKLPYKIEPIVLKKGCCIGMESIVMPGVTVGEGAIVGVGSLVTKDIPPYTIAVGRPAKVVRELPKRVDNQQITPPYAINKAFNRLFAPCAFNHGLTLQVA